MATIEEIESAFGAEEPGEEEVSAPPAESADTADPKEEEVKPEEGEEPKPEEEPAKPVEPAQEAPTAEQLAARVAELEKINNGLLQAKTASSAKARQAQEALQAAQEQLKLVQAQPKPDPKPEEETRQPVDRLKVEFDEDGNPYVPVESLPVNQDLTQKVSELEKQLSDTAQNLKVSQEERVRAETLKNFLSEKDGYQEAYVQVKDQWEYIRRELFEQIVASKGLPKPQTQAEALEIASDPDFQAAFKTKFPTGDAESVMQAYLFGGRYFERKALDAILEKQTPPSTHKPLPTDKPQPLATVTGASQAGDDDDLQKYADMSMDDFLAMKPEQEARMDRLMKEKGY